MTGPTILSRVFLAAAALLSVGAASSSTGDPTQGLDIPALRARAKAQSVDLDAFTREVAKRGDALRHDANVVRDGAVANRRRLPVGSGDRKSTFDFDSMVAGANSSDRPRMPGGPRLIVFVSTSIPSQSLKPLLRDVTRAGGVVTFRGLKNNSVKDFMAALSQSIDKGQRLDGVGVDPRLFRAFQVTAVPTFVVVTSEFEPCDGFHCTTVVPPYDRISGNVTTQYALERVAAGGGPGSAAARTYLARLNSARVR